MGAHPRMYIININLRFPTDFNKTFSLHKVCHITPTSPFQDKGYKQKAAACASDGYCARDEKCCPSKCAQRHVCLKANRIVEEIDGSGGAQELDF